MKLSSSTMCIFITLHLYLNVNSIYSLDVDKAVADFLTKHTGNGSNIDLATWQPPFEMRKNLVYYLSGFDYDDRPVWIAEWGKWDLKHYVTKGGKIFQALDNYIDQQMVNMLQSLKIRSTEENPVNEFIFIIDMDGYKYEQLSDPASVIYELGKFAGWNEIAQAVGNGYIVNTNFVAEKMVNLVRPVLGSAFSRFEVHGTNKDKWVPRLLRNIPRSQLPEWYGGVKDFKPLKIYGR